MHQALLVVNPYAGSVSARAEQGIIATLRSDFELEVANTTRRGHATDLARAAVDRNFDAVLTFGGDGTINEVMQALVGTDLALGILPGGSTNVTARALGVPRNPMRAAAFLAAPIRSGSKRRVNVGRVNGRYFLFSAGMGFDAEVVKRVEADPKGKRAHHQWTFLQNSLSAAIGEYRNSDPTITLQVEDEAPVRVVTALCCNARPLTYFGGLPVDACPRASLDSGLDLFSFKRITSLTIPRFVFSLFVSRSHPRWNNVHYCHDVGNATLEADAALPVQVDGDYIGEWSEVMWSLEPNALHLLI